MGSFALTAEEQGLSETWSSFPDRERRETGTEMKDRNQDLGALNEHTRTGSSLGVYFMAGQFDSPPN